MRVKERERATISVKLRPGDHYTGEDGTTYVVPSQEMLQDFDDYESGRTKGISYSTVEEMFADLGVG